MKLYLSSTGVGKNPFELKLWMMDYGKKIALIPNAYDYIKDNYVRESIIRRDKEEIEKVGFDVSVVSLSDYFNDHKKLEEDLSGFHAFYVLGGNVFTLRKAMQLSSFDEYIKTKSEKFDYLYAGYSAGICVLAPTLNGLDIVDEEINPYNNDKVIYDGLSIIDYTPIPHYDSSSKEWSLLDDIICYLESEKRSYKTLSDGESYVESVGKDKVNIKK